MDEKTKISEAEWEIMKIIWEHEPLTAKDVIENLFTVGATMWKPKTIKSLLSRLLNKDVIGYEKQGKEYMYFSKTTRGESIKTENDSFIKKVYDGGIKNMFVSFLENYNLSKEELDDLKKLINNKEKED